MGEEGGGKEEEGWWWQEMGNSQTFGYYWCKMKWNEHLQDEPTYENVSNISYLDSCIREALRCYPPIPTSVPFAHPSLFSPEITAGLFSFVFFKNSPLLMNRALSWRNVTPLKGLNIFHIWLFLLYFLLLLLSVYLSLHQLLLVCPLLCFLPLFLYLLAPEEDNFCRKRSCIIVSLRFVALVSPFP